MSSEEQNKKIMSAEEYSKSFKSNLSDLGNTGAKSSNTTSAATSNTSGMGSNYPVPDVVAKRFNWGACLLNWIWGLGNKTYITLLVFVFGLIPFIGGIICLGFIIWCGIKGNTWAWQNKKFDSVEAFHSNQRKWATAGVILEGIFIAIWIAVATLVLPVLMTNTSAKANDTLMKKASNTISMAVKLNKAMDEKCNLSSEGLAECFAKQILGDREGNVINAYDMSVYTFQGNGRCKNNGDCKVIIKVTFNNKTNTEEIPLYADSDGYIKIEQ